MTIRDICKALESFAPLSFQEDYDNSGLLTGSLDWEAKGALLTLDCTEAVVEEAIKKGCNLILAHHPLIFSGLKRINGNNYVEKAIIKAIKNDIAIYACHTNLDNVITGVNKKISDKLGLQNTSILAPKSGLLRKIVTYVPAGHEQKVMTALFEAGAGQIGNYDNCSFSVSGEGSFRGNADSQPFLGKPGELSKEKETRLELIFKSLQQSEVIKALLTAHPYEEVAYDIFKLENQNTQVGSGMIGEFEKAMDEKAFLSLVKSVFKVPFIKHTPILNRNIKKIAVCGGSGRFLLKNAIMAKADAYITSDFKYHEFFDAEGKILLVDTGHYESEQFTVEIFSEIIRKKFSTFAIHLSATNTNPVNYF